MASLELRNQTYRVVFMYAGKKYGYSLDTGEQDVAEALRGGVEKTLMLIGQGALRVPDGADLVAFVKNGGKVEEPSAPPAERLTLAALRDGYLAAHAQGAMEANSLDTVKMHLRHFAGTLGERSHVQGLTLDDLQKHVNGRARKKYRGRPLSPVTLKKETATFRAVWNWGVQAGKLTGPFPSRGLKFPKADEKPPFLTWQEIERKLAAGALSDEARAELWDGLYLRKSEIDELLGHVQRAATHTWVYPLVCTAAHTGARRSELLRAEVTDVNFDDGLVLIREKKRSRQQRTTRHVSLTPFLKQVLRDWLAVHPGGRYLFCQAGEVARSKKRSKTTGYKGEKTRATSLKGRKATVRDRERPGVLPLTKDEAHDHFKRTLAGSKWAVLRGYHVLRHSFISILAAGGVDQRIIDEFVGHQTDEQRRRYRHLVPDVKQKAIAGVFGG
jgi:integrase